MRKEDVKLSLYLGNIIIYTLRNLETNIEYKKLIQKVKGYNVDT